MPQPGPGPANPGTALHSCSLPVTGAGLRPRQWQSPPSGNATKGATAPSHGWGKPAWPWLLSKNVSFAASPVVGCRETRARELREVVLKTPLHNGAGGEHRNLGRSHRRPAAGGMRRKDSKTKTAGLRRRPRRDRVAGGEKLPGTGGACTGACSGGRRLRTPPARPPLAPTRCRPCPEAGSAPGRFLPHRRRERQHCSRPRRPRRRSPAPSLPAVPAPLPGPPPPPFRLLSSVSAEVPRWPAATAWPTAPGPAGSARLSPARRQAGSGETFVKKTFIYTSRQVQSIIHGLCQPQIFFIMKHKALSREPVA